MQNQYGCWVFIMNSVPDMDVRFLFCLGIFPSIICMFPTSFIVDRCGYDLEDKLHLRWTCYPCWVPTPIFIDEILGKHFIFGDPKGFIWFLPNAISDSLEEAPPYGDQVCNPRRCSFVMCECVLWSIKVSLSISSFETRYLNLLKGLVGRENICRHSQGVVGKLGGEVVTECYALMTHVKNSNNKNNVC